MSEEGSTCAQCGHAWAPHVVTPTRFTDVLAADGTVVHDVPAAGHVTCPEPECPCFATWGLRT